MATKPITAREEARIKAETRVKNLSRYSTQIRDLKKQLQGITSTLYTIQQGIESELELLTTDLAGAEHRPRLSTHPEPQEDAA